MKKLGRSIPVVICVVAVMATFAGGQLQGAWVTTNSVVFTPPDVFTYNATLSIANSVNGPANLPLSGTGLDGP